METLDYNSFAEACVEELKFLQDKFQDQYDVDWYDNWFYNQSTRLLTFSTGDLELNFRYFTVGSFSEKSSTWKWSWDNDTTLDSVKEKVNIIKEFGRSSNFAKLTTGYFDSDEFEAWEFVAIAAKLAGGIGVYRPVNDRQLQMFFVVTEFIDNEAAKKIRDKYVECEAHEYRRIAFVCRHLSHKTRVGFQEAFETAEDMELSDDDDFLAWCDECEVVRQSEGEWSERLINFAGLKIVCEKCYFEIKELNVEHR